MFLVSTRHLALVAAKLPHSGTPAPAGIGLKVVFFKHSTSEYIGIA